jgi:hypothetical protein
MAEAKRRAPPRYTAIAAKLREQFKRVGEDTGCARCDDSGTVWTVQGWRICTCICGEVARRQIADREAIDAS